MDEHLLYVEYTGHTDELLVRCRGCAYTHWPEGGEVDLNELTSLALEHEEETSA